MSRPTFIHIDASALKHNLQRVRSLAPSQSVIAMIKANGYGHGLIKAAHGLNSSEAFGVASLDEGIVLRDAGITQPIVLIEGLFSAKEIAIAAYYQFTLVIHHLLHLEMLEQTDQQHVFPVWIKINTGMHRLGIHVEEVPSFYKRLEALPNVKKPLGLMTHFAEADLLDSHLTTHQIKLFQQTVAPFEGPKSLANSAGIVAWPEAHGDFVRPGLILYGVSPFPGQIGDDLGLAPVMTVWTRLIAINEVKKGGRVGYGGTFTATDNLRIGIAAMGYGDGYPQCAKNGTPVLVSGVQCELVGKVSMDMLTINLQNAPSAKVGDPVILWGKGLPIERIVPYCSTSAYELLTRMRPRQKTESKMI